MKGISQFFDKFNNFAIKEIKKRQLIVQIIKNEIGEEIKIEDIIFRNNSIKINTNQIIKTEIFLKKQKILKEINKIQVNIKDIQ